jgi:integral membrane protein
MAWVTGILLAVMTVIGLPFKYIFDGSAAWYSIGWILHGWLFIVYVVTAVDICFRMKYSLGRTVLVVLAGTIPFASFFADHFVARTVHARLAEAPDTV